MKKAQIRKFTRALNQELCNHMKTDDLEKQTSASRVLEKLTVAQYVIFMSHPGKIMLIK
jgi:hypothetical protein